MMPIELAEKVAVAVMGGFAKDTVKMGVSFWGDKVKAELRKLMFSDEQINAIENIAKNANAETRNTDESFKKYMIEETQRIFTTFGDYNEIARGATIHGGEFVIRKEVHYHQHSSEGLKKNN